MDAVIVTHNSAADLRGFADCELSRAAFDRIVVIDNWSGDDTVKVARRAGFEVLQRTRNDGFGPAANFGIRQTRGDSVVLMNPDIRLKRSGALSRLQAALADPEVGIVAPALELPNGAVQDSAREIPMPWDLVGRRLTGLAIGAIWPTRVCDVPWVVGAFMVLRREAFEDVGGFDVRYRLYFEDVDLCVRLRNRGWKVRLDPEVRVCHLHHADSRAPLTHWSTRQHVKSAAKFYWRHRRLMRESPALAPARPLAPVGSTPAPMDLGQWT